MPTPTGPRPTSSTSPRHGRSGRGVLIYLRGNEERGIGLGQKLRTYELQNAGRDTVDADLELGLPPDARDHTDPAEILHDLGIDAVHLVTNNPDKESALRRHGVHVVTTVPTIMEPNTRNVCYLQTERDRMGHHLPDYGDETFRRGDPTSGSRSERP